MAREIMRQGGRKTTRQRRDEMFNLHVPSTYPWRTNIKYLEIELFFNMKNTMQRIICVCHIIGSKRNSILWPYNFEESWIFKFTGCLILVRTMLRIFIFIIYKKVSRRNVENQKLLQKLFQNTYIFRKREFRTQIFNWYFPI